jgi:lipopolysaccharide biosynthesis regulator YciM
MILGNLYRERGQVGRAIHVHQNLLQRPRLTTVEHAYALLCLGLDFRRGGFVDRAFEMFSEVLRLDPNNRYALLNLEKLHEDQHEWQAAHAIRQRIAALSGDDQQPRNNAILAFLENELGLEALKAANDAEAARHFQSAIELDGRAVPAYLNLGDVRLREGRNTEAAAAWEKIIRVAPERAYLAFERLESVYPKMNGASRFADLCRRLIAASPQDWRARLALGLHIAARGQPGDAIELLFDALRHNPHGLTIHQAIWRTLTELDLSPTLVRRYVDLTRDAVFYLDPHVCMGCRYRSTELLWQCPQCHELNTFIEERMAAAKGDEDAPA